MAVKGTRVFFLEPIFSRYGRLPLLFLEAARLSAKSIETLACAHGVQKMHTNCRLLAHYWHKISALKAQLMCTDCMPSVLLLHSAGLAFSCLYLLLISTFCDGLYLTHTRPGRELDQGSFFMS